MGLYSVVGQHGISETESTVNTEIISLETDVKVPDCLHHLKTLPDDLRASDFGAGGTLHDIGMFKKKESHTNCDE